MALLPSRTVLRRALRDGLRAVARRALQVEAEQGELTKVPDDLPRDGLFTVPLVVDAEVLGDAGHDGQGQHTVTFRVTVRDADGKRCADLHVEAEVAGPDRAAVGETTTDMFGSARFMMTGPPGTYRLEVRDVAAQALAWDRQTSTTVAEATVV